MANISWNVNIQVSGGPAITASMAAQPVEATDRIEVTMSPGDTDKVVDIQPSAANAIHLLMIKCDRYGTAFSFKASDGGADSTAVTLDGPQVFTGGTVALFGRAPRQLKFTNNSPDQTATVEIFVARDATPEGPAAREPRPRSGRQRGADVPSNRESTDSD